MSPARILVVDDEPTVLHVLRLQLEAAGYHVDDATDGATGLERTATLLPDLVLLDVMMPQMDGFEVCRRIRASKRTGHIPVIILTARHESEDKITGLQAGANDYLEKPFAYQELLARVQGVLAWSRAQREASPLTGLPGNVAIEAVTSERLAAGQPFAFLYMDIDQFKAFNDRYGYLRGDDAIRLTATLLAGVVEERGGADDFVGHIGGDDFVAVCAAAHADGIAEEMVRRFDRAAPALYAPDDRLRGYVEVQSRQGGIERAPLMALTVAVVTAGEDRRFTHYAGLIDVVAQLKRYGKQQPGSLVVRERRGDALAGYEVQSWPAAAAEKE